MRNLARAVLCGLFATSFAFTACGDDDKTTPDTTTPDTTTPDTTTPDTTTPDTTTPDTAAETTTPDTTAPTEQCLATADLDIICSGDKDPAAKAAACGQSATCIGLALQQKFDEFTTCTSTCMLDAERPGFAFAVSAGCTGCYVDSVRCTAEKCLSQCATNANSEACVTCRNDNGCTSGFFTCSGDIQAACAARQ